MKLEKLTKLTPRERHQAFEAAWCKDCSTCFEMGNHGSIPSACPFNMPEEIKEEFSDLL